MATPVPERLSMLRKQMRRFGLHAYLVPSTDAHQSEYLPACWQRRLWISGFTGSAGEYSVGQNSGMKLDASGGIEIYIAAEQPSGMPAENWLPITRDDLGLDVIMRVYVPDLE